MENLLECNICLEKYDSGEKIPRILKCGHTFCSKCLKELTKINSNLEMNLPFVKCPIDKTIGHSGKTIEEIPINRIIVDILDYSGFQFEKLSLKEEKEKEKMTYINSCLDNLKDFDKFLNNSYNTIRDNSYQLMNAKNNSIGEISQHYDKIINIIENQKASSLYEIEKYSKDKLNLYNEVLNSLDKYREMTQYKLHKLHTITRQRDITNITVADELEAIQNLGINHLEITEYTKEVDMILKEMSHDFYPKVFIKNEIDEEITEIVNSCKVIIPKVTPIEIFSINEELESLHINNSIYWFQQNSKNVYKKNMNETDWILTENKDNYVFKEMFRVCMINSEEALITGGGQGFICSNLTIYFNKGNFRKKQNMITERRSHSTCKSGDFVFVCGGINSKCESLSACEKFSLAHEKWIKISPMNVTKSHLSLCSFDNQFIFSIGGENKFQSLLDIIEKYTINLDIWETINIRMPTKIECTACLQLNNVEILILGGFSSEHGSVKSVYRLDTDKNTIITVDKQLEQPGWSIYQPIKQGRHFHLFYGGEEGYPPHHSVYELI